MSDVQGFPAFPTGSRRRRRTWWGSAWIQAMEDTAVDATLARRGRRIAAEGRIGPVTISPGRAAAVLDGAAPIVVAVEPLSADRWAHLAAEATVQSGHLAALLDGELPHALADLLPGIGELETQCGCDDWGNPCDHAAALCYQVAWLLDADPSLLLVLRGGSVETFGARPAGVSAADAFARPVRALPEPPPPVGDEPRPLVVAPPGIDASALADAATEAAARARELLANGAVDSSRGRP
ncbi:hypothetical protein [Kutzneria buriramensis]|uniref:Putative Zn finger protein n=1 Tax=Kutzneria buriramensis TaxID=1045776 RepID=A0A3E0HBL3_9PSEU|nr:hypothetical protein [Kutzneria buriramensis]REH41794.1 putative Zn finger protein [Kutzneria buriramensis]